MSSITVRWSTPSSARHSLTLRTSLLAPLVPDLPQARNLKPQRRAPLTSTTGPRKRQKSPKKLGFVPVEQLGAFLSGRADLDKLAEVQNKIGEYAVAAKAAIRTGKADAEPYRVTYFRFNDDAGLWLVATGTESELALLSGLLHGLAGLGGERTSGFGTFTITEAETPAQLAITTEAALLMTLSTALPADHELEPALAGATYRLVRRSGFISSATYAETPRRKRDLYKMAAGSVFTRPFEGVIADVGRGGAHPVYSYARPLFLALPEIA
ncbi:type III-A CRISPR-associated RAMP protein Csm4 [Mycobacterium sp. SM1]|uniref:type III-A CRISPR-associated RAMP protein Csm4 n=1 Tax=Mycobacterium sp. SM1 TaxID=2816243 RepID=UPI001BCDDF3C|nr:type III-A CRISPR-associated RAMP protein Csm4 [Mycobacterium sp. SM1]MBS4728527.1 type III-A CRISPR-associated RAMP protein Csm4 [Mycobacterium sp. SM1]